MVHEGCNCYFSFWTILCPFTPITFPLEMSSFYTSVLKIMIIWYTVPDIWHVMDAIVIFYFGLFFANSPQKPHKKTK